MGYADLSKTTRRKGNSLSKKKVASLRGIDTVSGLIQAAVNQE